MKEYEVNVGNLVGNEDYSENYIKKNLIALFIEKLSIEMNDKINQINKNLINQIESLNKNNYIKDINCENNIRAIVEEFIKYLNNISKT